MGDSYDEHVRAGIELGGDRWYFASYWLEGGYEVHYPRDTEIPAGAALIGIHEYHRSEDPDKDEWCGGYVHFLNVPEALLADERYGTESLHDLVKASPLTISPSLQCRQCPSHGYIREGVWSDC